MKFLKLKTIIIVTLVVVVSLALGGVVEIAIEKGADRLVSLQNDDGGWDWPLDDGNPANPSPLNTIGPIAMGLAKVYGNMSFDDNGYYEALQRAGDFLLAKTNNFSPSDGYLAAELDKVFEEEKYKEHVLTYFYEELEEGTYDRKGEGVLYDTAGYVNLIRTSRSGASANLAAWDIGMGLVGAESSGAVTSAWVEGVKAEIDELVGGAWYDVIGLAGAIYGLAFVGEDHDPQGGVHSSASSIGELADILITYQIENGGFSWISSYLSPGEDNETIQETSYAILALLEFDCSYYISNIRGAVDYLLSVQLETGGWKNWAGGGENNEVTAEALWAICNWDVCVVDVNIDIKPGSDPNSINLSSAGVIPVAILSSETFDATTVDPVTVSLAGAGVKMAGKSGKYLSHECDVNSDGLLDLVCQVLTEDWTIETGATIAVLEAETYDGQSIRGEDSVRIVPDN